MMASRGMGNIAKSKRPKVLRRKDGDKFSVYAEGGEVKSRVNEAGNYTQPGMRKRLFEKIKAGAKGGDPGEWSARKAQMLAREYKASGGGYK